MIDSFAAIAKIIPMLTVAGGVAATSPKLKAQIAKLLETTRVMATQQEVSDIAKMIYLDTLDGSQPDPADFIDYVRRNMRTKDGIQRDTSTDQWGSAYRLQYDRTRHQLVVSSAGPDRQYDTSDDIRGIHPLDGI